MAAAAAGEGDDGGKSSSAGFRCLDAARYVAAAVVIVLIAAVVVNAIKVVSRPDDITVLVVGNSVVTAKVADPPEKKDTLSFQFTLRAVNPGGRVRIYFSGIKVYSIFENSTLASTPTPDQNCSILFSTPDITLPPTKYVDDTKTANVSDDPSIVVPSFFDALYRRGGRVSGATVRVDGSVVAETSLGVNTRARHVTFYCRDLVVGPEDKDFMSGQAGTDCTKS